MTDNQDDLNSISGLEPLEDTDAPAQTGAKPGFPEADQARATHYVYDPETFEILCRPGQRLNQRKAQRLQELGLFEHFVTFAE
jgi:hypothetical protein